jgi:hypothetical protein
MSFFQNMYVENKNEQFEIKNGLQFQTVALHVFIWLQQKLKYWQNINNLTAGAQH